MNLTQFNNTFGMNGSVNSHLIEDTNIQFHELISHFCGQIDAKIVYAALGVIICYLVIYNVVPLIRIFIDKLIKENAQAQAFDSFLLDFPDRIKSFGETGILFLSSFIVLRIHLILIISRSVYSL